VIDSVFSILVSCNKYYSTAHIKDDHTASAVNYSIINVLANLPPPKKNLEFQLTTSEIETDDINQQQLYILAFLT
jgi:hypothetical protein